MPEMIDKIKQVGKKLLAGNQNKTISDIAKKVMGMASGIGK